MNFNKFRLSWINAREEYDFLARSNLLCEYFNKNKLPSLPFKNDHKIIDLSFK